MDTPKHVWDEASAHEAWQAAMKRMGDQARRRGMPISETKTFLRMANEEEERVVGIHRLFVKMGVAKDWRPEELIRTFVEIVEQKAKFERDGSGG